MEFTAPSRQDSCYDLSNSSKSCSTAHTHSCHHCDTMENCNFSASAVVSYAGARLSLPELNVYLTIPEGAVPRSHKQEITLSVLQEDRHRPRLSGKFAYFVEVDSLRRVLISNDFCFFYADKQTQLSPVVMCSPTGYTFRRPVILSFQHCASLKYGPWNISVLRSDCPVKNTAPIWQVCSSA